MEFLKAMQREVRAISQATGLEESKAFIIWFAKIAFDLDEDEAKEGLIDAPNDKGIDFFWVDDREKRVVIAQCKYSSSGEAHPRIKDLEILLGSTDWLKASRLLEGEGQPSLLEASERYSEALNRGFATQFWFVYCGPRDENILKRIEVYNANEKHVEQGFRAFDCSLSMLEKLYAEFSAQRSRVLGPAIIRACAHLPEVKGNFGNALVVSIPADALVALYDQFGELIFARDVRVWLGARKGSVNATMLDTLKNKNSERLNFWAYNNGITIVCNSYEYSEAEGEITLRGFSIVNGCQTTFALITASKEGVSLDGVSVLARIIAPKSEDVISNIALYTNSQNPVRPWELRAHDPVQQRLKQEFEGLSKPFFYETRRGELSRLDPRTRRKFRNGKTRRVKFDLLAQYLAAINGEAGVAYVNKALLFEDDQLYARTFRDDISVSEALFVWILGELVREQVNTRLIELSENIRKITAQPQEKSQLLESDKNGMSDFGRRILILKRGGRFFVLGVAGVLISYKNGTNYQAIARRRKEDEILGTKLRSKLKLYVEVSVTIYEQAVLDLLREESKELRDLHILIRQRDFFKKVSERARTLYDVWKWKIHLPEL